MANATVKGGFWGEISSLFTLSSGQPAIKRRIARIFNNAGMKGYREIYKTINGVAPGQLASESHKRVEARETDEGELGGLRTIETVVDVNRNTNADDVTDLATRILDYPLKPTVYPPNLDGNAKLLPGG